MVLTGQLVDAEEALRTGLITEIVDADDFIGAVQEKTARLGAASYAVAHAKRLVRLGAEDSLESAIARESETQEECFASDDFREGLRAFLDKRRPEFDGR